MLNKEELDSLMGEVSEALNHLSVTFQHCPFDLIQTC
uniref:Uncharacterized protein n=1 Tax=Anguilla anguilla TaxID=7936 RepID=A0A0E9TDW1_ANGAN